MSETPFMPLWVADFVGDTLDLDAKEIGTYMLILMTMWGRDGYLPNDDKKLQRVARCGRDWPRVWAALAHYFTVEGDKITQGRLLKEMQKVAAKRVVNAQHGARGGRAKALKSKEAHLANATVSLQQPEPYPYKKEDKGKPLSIEPDRFEEFWQIVPRKAAKEKARQAFAKASKAAPPETIIAGMRRYADQRKGQDQQYTAHPASWLNAGRWTDEPEQPQTIGGTIDRNSKGERFMRSFLAGAIDTPGMDLGQDFDPPRSLLARG